MEYFDLSNDGTRGTGLLDGQIDAALSSVPMRVEGRVAGLSGLTIEASDLPLPVGALCRIRTAGGSSAAGGQDPARISLSDGPPESTAGGFAGAGDVVAEVIGFQGPRTLLMALTPPSGVASGDPVLSITAASRVWCSDELMGRVLNGFGEPIDRRGPLGLGRARRIDGRSVAALERAAIREPISTSIRAIDALHTCGLGQRMGIFSGPGVGKSTLLAQIARHTSADVSVVALIGERGREVHDFVYHTLGQAGMDKCVVVVSTSDDPPLLRTRAARVACTIAEHFRDSGKHVLLLVDSLTRLAQAQRQIGLAAREPPATRGYPPSVFSLIPELLERAGRTPTGSITGFYTVLVEGDDFNEPIPDAVKGITDGHLMLTRTLANRGHFPAIDINQSISRVRGDVTPKEQGAMARRVLAMCATWNDIEDMVNIGAYQRGMNAEFDLVVETRPQIVKFLRQEAMSPVSLPEAQRQLAELCQWIETIERTMKASARKPQAAGTPTAPQAPATAATNAR